MGGKGKSIFYLNGVWNHKFEGLVRRERGKGFEAQGIAELGTKEREPVRGRGGRSLGPARRGRSAKAGKGGGRDIWPSSRNFTDRDFTRPIRERIAGK